MIGQYCKLYDVVDGDERLWVVEEYAHGVSEVFEDRARAIAYFEHTERYEAAQARKGRR